MPKVVYNPAAEFDLSQLVPELQQEVRAWEQVVELPKHDRVGYLKDVVGPVHIWFQVENREIHVCDIRVAA